MGTSRWSGDQYESYATSTGRATATKTELFSKFRRIDEKLHPRNVMVGKGDRKGLQLRESIISQENPNPTPIILALDVTGSMGEVAAQIARDELPRIMTEIHSTGVVSDPHVMFMGFDDVHVVGENALQVSYFEPDLKIVEQLSKMWLVGVGGGNSSESYDLPWYFAGKYTYLDGFEKQNRKGFLFSFGDEPAPTESMTTEELESVFGPGNYETTKPEQSLKMAQEKFQVFHICIEGASKSMRPGWTKLMGNNALWVQRNQVKHLTDIVLATMAIANGENIEKIIAESKVPQILRHAFSNSLGE
jgi:hypothetical protein